MPGKDGKKKGYGKKDATEQAECAPLMTTPNPTLWQQNVPLYEDDDFEESGYMEISPYPYHTGGGMQDAGYMDVSPNPNPPAATGAAPAPPNPNPNPNPNPHPHPNPNPRLSASAPAASGTSNPHPNPNPHTSASGGAAQAAPLPNNPPSAPSGQGSGDGPVMALRMKGLKVDAKGVPLPDGWEMKKTTDGRPFYICHATKTTSWVRPFAGPKPKVGDYIPLPAGWEFRRDPSPCFVDHNTRTTHICDPRPLPEGWQQRIRKKDNVAYFVDHINKTTQWQHPCSQRKSEQIEMKHDATGRLYFVNHLTRETSWDDPRLRPGFFGAAGEGLPPGFERCYTADGRTYYVDHHTRTTSWQPPSLPGYTPSAANALPRKV